MTMLRPWRSIVRPLAIIIVIATALTGIARADVPGNWICSKGDTSFGCLSAALAPPLLGVVGAASVALGGKVYLIGGGDIAVSNATQVYAPVTNTWSFAAPMPTARALTAATVGPDGHIYVMGGYGVGPGALNTVEAYNPVTNSWSCSVGDTSPGCTSTTLAPMPVAREGFALATALNSLGTKKLLYALGGGATEVDAYDLSTNTWTTVAPASAQHNSGAAVTGLDGKIYLMGGYETASSVESTVEAYTPSTNTWATVASMPTARQSLAAALGPRGRIYAIGGSDAAGNALGTIEVYSPVTNTWTTGNPLPTPRLGLMAAALGSRIYVLDGSKGESSPPLMEAYTVSTWTTVAPMPTPSYDLGAATGSDGRIYAFGGSTNVALAYTPSTNTWTTVAPMPTARYGAVVIEGPDGRVYVIGGLSGCCTYQNTVEAYTPSTNSWTCSVGDTSVGCSSTTIAPLPTPRIYMAAAIGSDGRIYVIGGVNASTFLATVEAYSPTTNTWTTVAPLPGPRVNFGAAEGSDGRIYAVGGYDGALNMLKTVEAYSPLTNSWSAVASLPMPVAEQAAVEGSDGRVYDVGGADAAGAALNQVFAYTPTTNSWKNVAAMTTPRYLLAAALGTDNRIYALGGSSSGGYSVEIGTTEQSPVTPFTAP